MNDTLRSRLAEQDTLYGGWIPGFLSTEAERLAAIEDMHARRPALVVPHLARPSLPYSVIRRANALLAQSPTCIWLDDDIDGLAVVLGAHVEVQVRAPRGRTLGSTDLRDWLAAEIERADVAKNVSIVDDAPAQGACDSAVISAGPPRATAEALARAISAVRAGGFIALQLRAPWDVAVLDAVQAAGFTYRVHHRELDFPVLPSGQVIDGAGDLVILERGETVTEATFDTTDEGQVRAQPYYWLDFDDLPSEKLTVGVLDLLADRVRDLRDQGEATRSLLKEEGREVLTWYAPNGLGFTAELARDERHLLLNLMPYDLELEYIAWTAVLDVLGDERTRVRPLLTTRFKEESIIG